MILKIALSTGQNGVSSEEFGSNDTIPVDKSDEDLKKTTTIHSTPTSTLDDGYESSNSTPLVSGEWLNSYCVDENFSLNSLV